MRWAKPADAPLLARLHLQDEGRPWSAEAFAQFLSSPGIAALVADDDTGQPTAFALVRQVGPEAEVMAIVVDRAHRRQGLAMGLMEKAVAELENHGVRSLFLEVAEDNPAAIALYERLGFAAIGRRRDYYQRQGGRTVSAKVLQLDLRGPARPAAAPLVDAGEKPS